MSLLFKRLLIVIAAIALPLIASLYVMQRFGTPAVVTQIIQADHDRQVKAAGGIWCFQFNPDGSPKDIFYGAEKCRP